MTPQSGASPPTASRFPRITMVTPALSSDVWLEATLRSVVYQDYPHLEYIVIEDGASAERRRILEKYKSQLSWQTCPPGTEL